MLSIRCWKKRESNIELLRICAMMMIIASHIYAHGGMVYSSDTPIYNKAWCQFLGMWGG